MLHDVVLLWNPINFVEGEGRWLGLVLLFLVGSTLLSYFMNVWMKKQGRQKSRSSFDSFIQAAHIPFLSFLWFVVLLYSLDLVTEHWLSEDFFSLFCTMVALAFLSAVGGTVAIYRHEKELQ